MQLSLWTPYDKYLPLFLLWLSAGWFLAQDTSKPGLKSLQERCTAQWATGAFVLPQQFRLLGLKSRRQILSPVVHTATPQRPHH